MRILFVAAEVAPFSSIGGLSQVMHYLPRALTKLGHDVRIFTAKYGVIDGSGGNQPPKKKWKMELVMEGLIVPVGDVGKQKQEAGNSASDKLICNVKISRASAEDPIIYFLENREYYELRANVYQYADDHIRFALLSKGCLEWLLQTKARAEGRGPRAEENPQSNSLQPSSFGLHPSGPWWPDLIHLSDWHTSYLADMARNDPRYKEAFANIPIVLTVHNFRHQGNGAYDFRFGPREERDTGKTPLPDLFSKDLLKSNALIRGIINADVVNTVSHTHAEEVLTPEYGEGIEDILLKQKEKLTGILNGVDTTLFSPVFDRHLKRRFSLSTLSARAENKVALQRQFSLPENPKIPLFAISGRMDRQKGIELLVEALPRLLTAHEFQFIALGGGDENFRNFFQQLAHEHSERVAVHLTPDFALPRKIFAGADVLLMPSKFEPGGIVAMEAMRYGCVPLVRRTGGLNDIVVDFDPETGIGNGFSFAAFDPWALYGSIVQSLTVYRDQRCWVRVVKNCIRADFSWDHAAREYEEMYERARQR